MMITEVITFAVMIWLAAGLLMQTWLTWRQDRFLARHGDNIPPAFAGTVTVAEQARTAAYGRARAWLKLFTNCWALLLALLWTLGGGLALLVTMIPSGWLGAVWLMAWFALLHELLRAPPQLLQIFVINARFGFNRASPLLVLRDTVLRTLLSALLAALASLILLPPVWLWGGFGWISSALLAVLCGGILLWVQPRVIAPMFNRFRPLPAGALRIRLEAMVARCGVRAESMFVMDNSKRSTLANAYFSGFGHNKRVVLFDTLLASLDDDEIEAVLAHELGHNRKGHLRRHYSVIAILLATGVILTGGAGHIGLLATLSLPANSSTWLAAGYLLLPLFAWPLRPWLAARLRRYEFEADAYAAQHADGQALTSALKKLLACNAAPPRSDPLYTAFYASHPPFEQRFARLAHIERTRSTAP